MRGESSPRASGAGGPRSSEMTKVGDKTKGLLSRVVRYGRTRRGMSQQQIAERLGVKQPNVAKLESGKPLREETVERFAAALGSTFEEIVLEYLDAKRAGLLAAEETPPEEYEPPGPSRERQLRRLYAACGDVAAVARVVGKTRQGVAQQLMKYGIRT